MAPPTENELQKITKKELPLAEVKSIMQDYVRPDDLEMMCNFFMGASVSLEQLNAVVNGDYELKKVVKPDGGYSLSMNFDLSNIKPYAFDGPLPTGVMSTVISADTECDKRKRILKGLIKDDDLDLVCELIKSGGYDLASLDTILKGNYTLQRTPPAEITLTESCELDKTKLDSHDDAQLNDILNGKYTSHQLVKLFSDKFKVDEIRSIFDAGLSLNQLKGLLHGNYEIARREMDDGKGYIIELTYGKESYKDHLQAVLDGKYSLEQVLKLFGNRLSLDELKSVLSMNIDVPQLHALIIGDYVVERVDNPDGSYSMQIVYNKGAGEVKEIDEIGDPSDQVATTDDAKKLELADKEDKKTDESKVAGSQTARPKADEKPIGGDVKQLMKEAEEAAKMAKLGGYHTVATTDAPQKVKIPDLTNEKGWNIDKGSKLKIPSIFASAVKPGFYKGSKVKHLEKNQVKDFYDVKGSKK